MPRGVGFGFRIPDIKFLLETGSFYNVWSLRSIWELFPDTGVVAEFIFFPLWNSMQKSIPKGKKESIIKQS